MRDAFYYLRDHNDPPALGTDACADFFLNAAKDMGTLVSVTWKNHPLAQNLILAIYEYLDVKCKAKAGGAS